MYFIMGQFHLLWMHVFVKHKWDKILRNNAMYISISLQCSILVLHFEEFQMQKKLIQLHISSKYSKEMAQKSDGELGVSVHK